MELERPSQGPDAAGQATQEARGEEDATGLGDLHSFYAAEQAGRGEKHDFSWALLGDQGLRAGWSAAIFVGLYYLLLPVLDTIAVTVFPSLGLGGFSPYRMLIGESVPFAAILCAALFVARMEGRRLLDYNLGGRARLLYFISGAGAGFVALSALIGALAAGGWIHFGGVALSRPQALKFGLVWGGAFLLVGFCEEGSFRCFLQFTLTRGINFWWALAAVSGFCLIPLASGNQEGAGGVYLIALLGLVPCFLLHVNKAHGASFWQAAWTTSTAFGYYHTSNNGENWIGIFAAALIGFLFCVSVRVTGSAWWAIGCHTAWDWAETYFYGTADSGLVAQRHLLTTTAAGNALWSGGADGPEGSLLVVPVTLLLMAALLFVYGGKKPAGGLAG